MARQVSIKWNASGAIRIVTRATVKATKDLMEEVKNKAVQYCPLDKGDLRNSAHVEYWNSSTVCYFEEPYALLQHENLEFRHRVGQAKYLERAFNEVMPHCRYNIQQTVDQELGRG